MTWLGEDRWLSATAPAGDHAVFEVAVLDEDLGVIVTCRTPDGRVFTGADAGGAGMAAERWRVFHGDWSYEGDDFTAGEPGDWTHLDERNIPSWHSARNIAIERLRPHLDGDCPPCRDEASDEMARLTALEPDTEWLGGIEGDDLVILRERPTPRPSVHPTHAPDHLVAMLPGAAGTWCSQCDRPVAFSGEATDHGAKPCPSYRTRIVVTGV